MRTRSLCNAPDCPNLQPCAMHAPKPWSTKKPGQHGGSGWAWQRIRQRVLERDMRLCRFRYAGCTRLATTAGHIVARAQGGSDEPHNLAASCAQCNETKRRDEARAGSTPPHGGPTP